MTGAEVGTVSNTRVDPVVEAVRADLLQRSQTGIAKYDHTLDRTDIDLRGWLQHQYEELLDAANYCKRAILELDQASPLPMRLTCPGCGKLHIDEGDLATRPHHTHACQYCGMVWRPAIVRTVGVEFLPGFKNAPEPATAPLTIEWGMPRTNELPVFVPYERFPMRKGAEPLFFAPPIIKENPGAYTWKPYSAFGVAGWHWSRNERGKLTIQEIVQRSDGAGYPPNDCQGERVLRHPADFDVVGEQRETKQMPDCPRFARNAGSGIPFCATGSFPFEVNEAPCAGCPHSGW